MNADDAPDPMDAPADRFCDIVMEGGVTSGIIYAAAVVELARHYRLKNIGGSSIGAFAAALAAAAEYRRRKGSGEGFDALAGLPAKLAEEEDHRTLLERLFVPQPGTQRPFRIFLAMLERAPMTGAFFAAKAALGQYRWHVAGVALVLVALVLAGPIVEVVRCTTDGPALACAVPLLSFAAAAFMACGIAVVLGIAIGLAYDLGHAAVENGFGLCRGWAADAAPDRLDLASFLHRSIQSVAGRKIDENPLTFRDLWNAPGSASQQLGFPAYGAGARSINLEVYASNLTHGRPYRFPLEPTDDTGRLFFRIDDLQNYFPRGIVQWLAAFARPYEPHSELDPPLRDVESGYLELPVADMPIVVAARLAMSFPVLISAVPLYAVNTHHGRIERCWISDGGLCSNFPIHLFDSFLPMWPTFGISLGSRAATDPRTVWLPRHHTSGRADTWDEALENSAWRLGGFLGSLWRTTWRWNDSTMMRMPGVRDRVVRIYLTDGEGGVNIRMRAARIAMLGEKYGRPAAQAFVDKFLSPDRRGWEEHRWVRFNDLLVALRERVRNFGASAALERHTLPLRDQIAAAGASAPLAKPAERDATWPSEQPLAPAQLHELNALLDALCDLEKAFTQAGDTEPYRAIPKPALRMRPPA